MLWFSPPSYLKWLGAAAVVALSWWIQLMPAPTSWHPFAATHIAVGTEVDEHLFEYRETPAGLLPPVAVDGVLTVAMTAGDPLLPSFLSYDRALIPDGWWAMELEAPPGLAPGSYVMLVTGGDEMGFAQPPIPGMVIRPGGEGSYGPQTTLIAVPQDQLSQLSTASAYGTLTVAVAPDR